MNNVWFTCDTVKSSIRFLAPEAKDRGVKAGFWRKHLTASMYSLRSDKLKSTLPTRQLYVFVLNSLAYHDLLTRTFSSVQKCSLLFVCLEI